MLHGSSLPINVSAPALPLLPEVLRDVVSHSIEEAQAPFNQPLCMWS